MIGGMAQMLQQLLSSPQAQAMMQDPQLQQAGAQAMQSPGAMQQALGGLMQMVSGGGAGPMAPGEDMGVGNAGAMPMNEGEDDTMPSTEDELAMVQDQLEPAHEWEGTKAPTQADIEFMRQNPTDGVLEDFEARFGEGTAGQYLNTDEGDIETGEEVPDDVEDY